MKPSVLSVLETSGFLGLTDADKFRRYAATWISHRDFARSFPARRHSRLFTASATTRPISMTSRRGKVCLGSDRRMERASGQFKLSSSTTDLESTRRPTAASNCRKCDVVKWRSNALRSA